MRESVFVRVNGALNRQHVRGSESHVPPSIGLSFAPPILRRNGSAHSSNVTRLGTDAYTIVSSEGRDCNQRLITNGCEAAFAARGAGMIVSLAVGSSGKKQAGSFAAASLFSRPLLLGFNHSHPRPLLKSMDLSLRLL